MTILSKTPIAALLALGLAATPTPGAAQAASATDPAAARREDLRHFRTEFLERDRAYSAPRRAEAETRLTRLERDAASLSPAQFELELARIVALADNGHTMAFAGPRSRRFNRVPFRLTPFGEQLYVLRTDTAHADLLGARLAAVDGRSASDLIAVARTLAGGTNGFRDRNAGFLLESPEQLHALGAARGRDAASYRFVLTNGRTVERRIAARPPDAGRDQSGSGRWLYPEPLENDQGAWRLLLAPAQAPWALQDAAVPFRWRQAPELDAMVIELRQNHDAPGRPIRDVLAEITEEIRRASPRHLVLDLRMNGGGDLNTTRDFMKSLPTLVPGRIFALTSPWTFSAAISSVGYLEQAAPERVTIVGEMVGDRLEFWSEGRVIELPHSGARILYATERHDYRTGCRPFQDCHGPVVRNPISVPSLAPDIPSPWTIEAYRAGRDPAMEAVGEALRRS